GAALTCDYERTGHLQAAWRRSHFEALTREQALLARVFHHRVDILPREKQRDEIGSDAYWGVLVDERSAGLNPGLYVDGLARLACRAGARLLERTTVTRVDRLGTRWAVSTDRGTIDAGDLLVAVNGYVDDAVPWMKRRYIPVGSFVIAT